MGAWSTSLYGNDFAMDLRSAIGAVVRLPFEPDHLVELLADTEPGAANAPADPDHATFWLVVADQFAKRGIVVPRVHEKAFRLIDSAAIDAAALGMPPADVRKRVKILEELRTRLLAMPAESRPRTVLRKPQAFVLDVGQVVIYPTDVGNHINPYYKSKTLITHWTKDGTRPWTADGWGALVVVERDRAFDYLTWYRAVVAARSTVARPSLETVLAADVEWRLTRPGTVTALHMKRMEFEPIGQVAIDAARLAALFPTRPSGRTYAISDISIANDMNTIPARPDELRERLSRRLALSRAFTGLRQLLAT